jgi:4,5:9,10-diseco-3-hydroxy-5,9,17-trioxoandrosta-1(10),2-diene-4-oate hydrolase
VSLPEGQYAEINGHRVHFHVVGTGPALVFLHGSGPGASGWSNFIGNAEVFAAAGFQCVLVDNLGYGLSSKPDLDYGMDVIAAGTVAVLDQLGIEVCTLVGNSHGGAQAMWLVLNHPERVERLILMAPGGLETRETYMSMRGIRSMMRCIYGPEGITLAGMQKVFEKQLFDTSCVPEGVVQQRYELSLTQPTRVFRTLAVPDLSERLGEITCPTLALWGVNDLFCPVSGAEKLATGIPNCRVTVFSQCGHWVMVEKRAAFDRLVLDFLNHG